MASTDTAEQALFLLPALSLPLSRPSLQTAYKGTFEALLTKLKPHLSKTSIFRLDIGVALSQSYPSTASTSRTAFYDDLQSLLQETYNLVCLAAVSTQSDLDIPGGLDVRIVLLEPDQSSISANSAGRQHLSGPVIDLKTFLTSPLPSTVFSTESESGLNLEKFFTTIYQTLHKTRPTITRLPSGPSLTLSIPTSPLLGTSFTSPLHPDPTDPTIHHSVAVGGTFDHLHLGHKLLLTGVLLLASPTPFSTTRKLTIGITGDALLVNKKYASALEPWTIRQARAQDFIESILVHHPSPSSLRSIENLDEDRPNGKVVRVTYTPPTPPGGGVPIEGPVVVNYIQIQDPFGPTITEEDITAIVLTAETRKGGEAINEKRRAKGWKELEVFEVGVLDASPGDGEAEGEVKEGFEGKISSTEIRRRVLEQQGK